MLEFLFYTREWDKRVINPKKKTYNIYFKHILSISKLVGWMHTPNTNSIKSIYSKYIRMLITFI